MWVQSLQIWRQRDMINLPSIRQKVNAGGVEGHAGDKGMKTESFTWTPNGQKQIKHSLHDQSRYFWCKLMQIIWPHKNTWSTLFDWFEFDYNSSVQLLDCIVPLVHIQYDLNIFFMLLRRNLYPSCDPSIMQSLNIPHAERGLVSRCKWTPKPTAEE